MQSYEILLAAAKTGGNKSDSGGLRESNLLDVFGSYICRIGDNAAITCRAVHLGALIR